MGSAGLRSLFPMSDLSVMGFAELLPALPRLALRLRQTVAAAREEAPALVVGIDSKGFCLRVLRALAADRAGGASTPALAQLAAPSAWAFADARARAVQLSGVLDELLLLLPFEEALYRDAGVPCTFVGHPALECAGPAPFEAHAPGRGLQPGGWRQHAQCAPPFPPSDAPLGGP